MFFVGMEAKNHKKGGIQHLPGRIRAKLVTIML